MSEAMATLDAKLDAFVKARKWLRLKLDGPDTWAELMEMPGVKDEADRHERRLWRRAFVTLWTEHEGDWEEMGRAERFLANLQCSLAMILGRRLSASYDGDFVVSWDLHHYGLGGWSCQTLSFNRRKFRFGIFSDGE